MDRKMSRNVQKTWSSNRQNAPSEDRCAGNALKGLEARRPPLPGARWPSRRLPEAEWATHSLAPGKRGWPPTSNHHVALATCQPPYPTPSSATRNWVRLACVTCYEMLRFSAFSRISNTRLRRKLLINKGLRLVASGCSFDENQRKRMTIKELRHSQ